MNTTLEPPPADLAELQLCVARRADELRPRFGSGPENDRRAWLRAEFELFEQFERGCPALLEHCEC